MKPNINSIISEYENVSEIANTLLAECQRLSAENDRLLTGIKAVLDYESNVFLDEIATKQYMLQQLLLNK